MTARVLIAWFLVVCLVLALFISAMTASNSANFTSGWLFLLAGVLVLIYRLDPVNIVTVYWAPWLLMLSLSLIDISEFHRPIALSTAALVVSSLLACALALPPSRLPNARIQADFQVEMGAYNVTGIVFLMFCSLNILLAGYIPLLRVAAGEDSGYMTFGVKGVYGLFNAFANAFGVASFYFWKHTGKKIFRNYLFLVVTAFTLFVTRQNLISLIVECFIVYSLSIKKLSMLKLLVGLGILLLGFSVAGDLRESTEIALLVRVYDQYSWLPNPFIWIYAYFYFNLLNLDNIVSQGLPPTYDGSSLYLLIPSFLRPDLSVKESALEVSNFTANPFISTIYQDAGIAGVVIITVLFAIGTRVALRHIDGRFRLLSLGSYSTLFFCFLFSFFENFFFYLPIIAQILFFALFEYTILNRSRPSGDRPAGKVGRRRSRLAR